MSSRILLLTCFMLVAAAAPASGQPPWWCWDGDEFTTSVEGGYITITHQNALYNCCPSHFEYSVDQYEGFIWVDEAAVVPLPCPCLCCFKIPLRIGPYPAGQYRIIFGWIDEVSGPREVFLDVTVPEGGQEQLPLRDLVIVDRPPCLDNPPASVGPGPPPDDGLAASELGLSPILHSAYPNPAHGSATIAYELRRGQRIRLAVFNAGGVMIRLLQDKEVGAGEHRVEWDGRDEAGAPVPAGVYFCALAGQGSVVRGRLVIVR